MLLFLLLQFSFPPFPAVLAFAVLFPHLTPPLVPAALVVLALVFLVALAILSILAPLILFALISLAAPFPVPVPVPVPLARLVPIVLVLSVVPALGPAALALLSLSMLEILLPLLLLLSLLPLSSCPSTSFSSTILFEANVIPLNRWECYATFQLTQKGKVYCTELKKLCDAFTRVDPFNWLSRGSKML